MGNCSSSHTYNSSKDKLYNNMSEVKRLESESKFTPLPQWFFDKIIDLSFHFIMKQNKILTGIIIVMEKNLSTINESEEIYKNYITSHKDNVAYITLLMVDKRFQR